jgi:glucuronate isomerase
MIGVLKERYKQGVYQGRDLFSPVSSMSGYEYLFNQFPGVNFLVSVLPDTQVHEMRTYCWIRHNVKVSGHWWYQNTPSMIKPDLNTRIEILPDNKMIGYYSDAYKLEFVFPKFRMYKKILAEVLAEKVIRSDYDPDPYTAAFTEDDAYKTGRKLLYENPVTLFGAKKKTGG